MSAPLRYGELFAGAGGMSLGLERAGLSCALHAELADFPRRVLSHRWPDVPLYGDVSTLDGHALVASHGPLDLLAGGSPCQDMSVAGKRAGLAGARSGLFYEQLRLWNETGATYLLWENVAGALSSNAGADFAAVLSAIVGAPVVVPRDGWRGAGVVSGPGAVAAWRLLDAQWFGVPQRRLRVFVLGARVGGVDPAEVLLEPQGMRRHPPTRGEAGQGAARSAGDGTGAPGIGFYTKLGTQGGGVEIDAAATLKTQNINGVVSFGWQNSAAQGDEVEAEQPAPLRAKTTPAVMAFSPLQGGRSMPVTEECPTLEAGTGNKAPAVFCFSAKDSGAGTPIIANTLCASGTKGWDSDPSTNTFVPTLGIPRRLMPIECERLMSWEDGWTDVPDANGKPASDAARYKACGNGVVSNVAQWIGERLANSHLSLRQSA